MTSLVGPTEKIVIADHPINNFYFTLAGVPQVDFIVNIIFVLHFLLSQVDLEILMYSRCGFGAPS